LGIREEGGMTSSISSSSNGTYIQAPCNSSLYFLHGKHSHPILSH
jgi:hypothetical protein